MSMLHLLYRSVDSQRQWYWYLMVFVKDLLVDLDCSGDLNLLSRRVVHYYLCSSLAGYEKTSFARFLVFCRDYLNQL